MTPEEQFDAVLRANGIGSRLDFSNLEPRGVDLFKSFASHARDMIREAEGERTIKPIPVHFDFAVNPRLGAVAFTAGQDFIGLYMGTVLVVFDVFHRMMSHPDVLPEIGDPSLERSEGLAVPKLPTSLAELRGLKVPSPRPRDPRRDAFASTLMWMASDFLIAHELAHVRNGHVDLVKGSGGLCLAETANSGPLPPLTMQTLEMDADCGATLRSMNLALRHCDQIAAVPEEHRWRVVDSAGSYEKATYAVLFSAYVIFRLFDETFWAQGHLDQRSHPPAPIRQVLIMSTAEEVLKRHKMTDVLGSFGSLVQRVIRDAEGACASLLGRAEPITDGIRGATADFSRQHVGRLLEHWKDVRPRLDPLKRGGRLAD